jgi:transposase
LRCPKHRQGRQELSCDTSRAVKCKRWLKKHPKVHFHFIPTRSSRLKQIETWFSILKNQSLSGASFTTAVELRRIDAFISTYNQTATPFAWTKKKGYQRRLS